MPAFMFEKISPPVHQGGSIPAVTIREPRGVIVQMLDRLTESRLQREAPEVVVQALRGAQADSVGRVGQDEAGRTRGQAAVAQVGHRPGDEGLDPGAGGVYSDPNTFQATGSKTGTFYYPNNLKGHGNLGAFRNATDRSTLAVGLYMTTLPFQAATPTDVQNAYSTSATYVDDWYKAFFSRLKDQSTFYDDPVIVIRPNWEAMGQDTGMQLGVGAGLHTAAQWYQAGYTQTQYNAMMRKFCRIGKQYGPPNLNLRSRLEPLQDGSQ